MARRNADEGTEWEPRDPTPEEIRARCEAIQATWSEEERAVRAIMSLSKRPTPRDANIGYQFPVIAYRRIFGSRKRKSDGDG